MRPIAAPLLACLLLLAGWPGPSCGAPADLGGERVQQDAALAQFEALGPVQAVAAHALLSELAALRALASEGDALPPTALGHSLASAQEHLVTLLPALGSSGAADVVTLARRAAAALAGRLAAAAAGAEAGSAKSRLARTLTLVNIAWFVGCLLLVVAAVALVGRYLAALVLLVPLPVWEAAGYAASAALLRAAGATHAGGAAPGTAPYVALTGLLGLTACGAGSFALHAPPALKRSEAAASALMAVAAGAYGAAALRLQATLLGTLAVWWGVSALGFAIEVFPFVTYLGFRSGLARPFAACGAALLAAAPAKVAPRLLPAAVLLALRPFEPGIWLWCPLVMNLVSLIASHRRWGRAGGGGLSRIPPEAWAALPARVRLRLLAGAAGGYLAAQLPSLAVVAATLAAGVLLDVEPCRALGAVFGFLWMASRLAEADWARVGFAWGALAAGALLWGAAYVAHAHPALLGLLGLRRGAH